MPITTVTARGKALLARKSKAQIAFAPAGDPDDVEGLREKYKKANPAPLWDEGGSKPTAPQASIGAATSRASTFAATLSKAISRRVGRRSRAQWEANRDARQRAFESKAPVRYTQSGWRLRNTKYVPT